MARSGQVVLFITVAVALIYGTLFPLSGWQMPVESIWAQFVTKNDRIGFGDFVTNLIVYIPFGFAFAMMLSKRSSGLLRIIAATGAGFLFSLSLEVCQGLLPGRVSSLYDLLLNTIGAALGAVAALSLTPNNSLGRIVHKLRVDYVKPGVLPSLGIVIACLWMSAHLVPFVPSLDIGNLKQGLKPFVLLFSGDRPFSLRSGTEYLCASFVIALVLREACRRRPGRFIRIVLFILAVIGLKVLIVGRQLTPEALIGTAIGLGLAHLGRNRSRRRMRMTAMGALILLICIQGLAVDPARVAAVGRFNWIPFRGHFVNNIIGMADLIAGAWPYCALVFLAWASRWTSKVTLIGGLLGITALSFGLEWRQQFLPGRLADITDVIIPLLAWSVSWFALSREPPRRVRESARRARKSSRRRRDTTQRSRDTGQRTRDTARRARSTSKQRPRPVKPKRATGIVFMWICGFLLLTFGVGAWLSSLPPVAVEQPLNEAELTQLAAPHELPAVSFDEFRTTHPRLPAPSLDDLERLREQNPQYLDDRVKRAKNSRGNLSDAVFAVLAEPATQDLEYLYQQLTLQEFTSRGHEQVKPLALAYDWLYSRWTPAQRDALREKLLDGCEYIIERIRDQRLSPYNVILYNSPFQALVACAITTHGESPRADPVMRFTYDLWEQRVLPVWRQVMGTRGGWHEGGEYVGIGIGQAIYQVPALWRHATGKNYFTAEPGIRGFLDFLRYRTRPDGTYFRWGDAAHFDRESPDRLALAIELGRHPGIACNKQHLRPVSWPWGPLADEATCAALPSTEQPLTKFFDGLGLFVGRSSWSADSTYVTFKAGDNYWSHSHLDQGSFTIFKGQALAIDSGVYGPSSGSDHHMNYTYQTIAHNVVTVTDPNDIIPVQTSDGGTRYFANDGGQRRVGSGWGVEAAPVDLDEWRRKSDTYHTAKILRHEETPSHTIIVADLTPAYTNQLSGKNTFSHRTRRVEKYVRTFVHDRRLDGVAIYDRVEVSDPRFQVRWLLHSQAKPNISHKGFNIHLGSGNAERTKADAGLEGFVMLPNEPNISRIGGPGFEFYVDDKNYDEGGKLYKIIREKSELEPGEWRIEVQPSVEQSVSRFLVFLFPWAEIPRPSMELGCTASAASVDCIIESSQGTAKYTINNITHELSLTRGARAY